MSICLFYFDESGDSGLVNSPARFFVLLCMIIPLIPMNIDN
jgi:hypothetical protein